MEYYTSTVDFGASYEYLQLSGYPRMEISDLKQSEENGKYVQAYDVYFEKLAYVKYGFYSTSDFTEQEARTALMLDENAARLTESQKVTYDKIGSFYFVALGCNEDGEVVCENINTFTIDKAIDLTAWSYIGKSKFYDNWIMPIYGYSAADFCWDIDTYILNEDSGIVGLYKPYEADDCPARYDVGAHVMIQIDMTDRDFILIRPQYSGVNLYGGLDIMNLEAYYLENSGYSKDVIKSALDSNNNSTTLVGNVLTVPYCQLYIYEDSFYGSLSTDAGYIYLPEDYFNSVRDIVTDADDANAEYFNLNGVRMANPTVPGLYIRRQGSKVSKVVIK